MALSTAVVIQSTLALINVIIIAALFASTLLIFRRYIKQYINTDEKPTALLFGAAVALSIFTLCTMLLIATATTFTLVHVIWKQFHISPQLFHCFAIIFFAAYQLQHYFLSLTLFVRLWTIFRDSAFALSVLPIYCFAAIFTVQPICIALVAIVQAVNGHTLRWYILVSFNIAFLILLCLLLMLLYIYKLVQVHKFHEESTAILQVITNTSTLAVLSTVVSLSTAVSIIYKYASARADSYYLYPLIDTAVACDLQMGFLSVMLCFKYFQKYYDMLCGCLHRLCHPLCQRSLLSKNKHASELEKYVAHHAGNNHAANMKSDAEIQDVNDSPNITGRKRVYTESEIADGTKNTNEITMVHPHIASKDANHLDPGNSNLKQPTLKPLPSMKLSKKLSLRMHNTFSLSLIESTPDATEEDAGFTLELERLSTSKDTRELEHIEKRDNGRSKSNKDKTVANGHTKNLQLPSLKLTKSHNNLSLSLIESTPTNNNGTCKPDFDDMNDGNWVIVETQEEAPQSEASRNAVPSNVDLDSIINAYGVR